MVDLPPLNDGGQSASTNPSQATATTVVAPVVKSAASAANTTAAGAAPIAANINGLPPLEPQPAISVAARQDATMTNSIVSTLGPTDMTSSLGDVPSTQPASPTLPQVSVLGAANLAEAALKKGLIDEGQAAQVKQQVTTGGKSIEEALMGMGVDEDTLYHTKAEMFGVEFVDLGKVDIDPAVLQKISQDVARRNLAVAFASGPRGVRVAMADPLDIQKTKYIGALVGGSIEPVFSSPALINFIIDNKYNAQVGAEVEEALEEFDEGAIQLGGAVGQVTDLASSGGLANAPVSKIVNMVLEYAIRYQASDVHIEPREDKVSVRLRIFGVLNEKLSLPKKLHPAIVSRIKILSNLKIDEHRVPQDGRFQVKLGKDNVDLRVSIIPAAYGEKVVMRLLKKGGGAMDLPATGLRGHAFKLFSQALTKTQGIVLVTGPTGSGKTQTLASGLKVLNSPEVNIMTLEDPVEIRIDGINQVQINNDVGLTFARGLRAFLRQDPDIIMVGEIRDSETAGLAVQAALTGHLVLATLHTNSAAGAPPRLLDMEVEPFLLASTMNVVLGQRLVRTICPDCKEAYYASPEVSEQIHNVIGGLKTFDMFKLQNNDAGDPANKADDKIVLYRGKGCSKCNGTGYVGRIGIFEALDINEKISKLILQHSSAGDIAKAADEGGMVTMVQDGFMKALEGVTTIEEVLRVQTG
jgi:type IV pilus assembly protein PilB